MKPENNILPGRRIGFLSGLESDLQPIFEFEDFLTVGEAKEYMKARVIIIRYCLSGHPLAPAEREKLERAKEAVARLQCQFLKRIDNCAEIVSSSRIDDVGEHRMWRLGYLCIYQESRNPGAFLFSDFCNVSHDTEFTGLGATHHGWVEIDNNVLITRYFDRLKYESYHDLTWAENVTRLLQLPLWDQTTYFVSHSPTTKWCVRNVQTMEIVSTRLFSERVQGECERLNNIYYG